MASLFLPSLYSLPPLVSGIVTFFLGLFILVKRPASPINRAFALVNASATIWLLGFAVLYSTKDPSTAKIVIKLLYTGVIFIPITFFHFTKRLTTTLPNRRSIRLNYAFGFIFELFLLFSDNQFVGLQTYYWGYQTKAGPINSFFLAYFHAIFLYCLITLFKYIKNPGTSYIEKMRAKYVFASFLIALLGAFDWLPVYGIAYYPLGPFFLIFFTLTTSYTILKYKLFDLNIIIRRSFIYSALIFAITSIYLAIILIGEYFFRTFFGYASLITAIVASSIIALAFNPLRAKIQTIVDLYFFKIDPEKLAIENSRLKAAVQDQERMRAVATLAAGMAHEIKNPLTAIKTFTEHLPAHVADEAFIQKFTKIVGSEVGKIDTIVGQLLEFSRPSSPQLEKMDIIQTIESTLALLDAEFVKHRVQIIKQFGSPSAWINGDRKQLQQVFLNLFLNSVQAMPGGGSLTITAHSESDDHFSVQISDTGHGISAEALPHIFDPFFTTKESGTGLGLAITHGILKEHNCKISVKSQSGIGTSFVIVFNGLGA